MELIKLNDFLPHQAPFLLVDYVSAFHSDGIETIFGITKDCLFIDNGLMNESGLIENAAQNCSATISLLDNFKKHTDINRFEDVTGYISTIKTLNIYKLPKVGSTITTISKLLNYHQVLNDYILNLKVETFDEAKNILLSAEMTMFIKDKV